MFCIRENLLIFIHLEKSNNLWPSISVEGKKKEIFKLVWESYRLQCLNIVLKTETNYLVEKKKKMNQGLTFLPVHLAEKNSRSEFLKSWNCMNCLLFTVCSLY